MSTIYPPPTVKELIKVMHCISLNRFILLLDSGTILIYNFEKETAILEKM